MGKLAVVLVENRGNQYQIASKHLRFLPKDSVLYIDESVNSITDYNKLLTSLSFWNKINEENILIIQHDSALLRYGVEEFYKYDYIGASWNFPPYVGNGGLSFRHKSAMIKVINNYHYNGVDNEDIYFAHGCNLLRLNIAPIKVANTFSCETQFHLGTLGCHAIEKYLKTDQVNQIKNQYL